MAQVSLYFICHNACDGSRDACRILSVLQHDSTLSLVLLSFCLLTSFLSDGAKSPELVGVGTGDEVGVRPVTALSFSSRIFTFFFSSTTNIQTKK